MTSASHTEPMTGLSPGARASWRRFWRYALLYRGKWRTRPSPVCPQLRNSQTPLPTSGTWRTPTTATWRNMLQTHSRCDLTRRDELTQARPPVASGAG